MLENMMNSEPSPRGSYLSSMWHKMVPMSEAFLLSYWPTSEPSLLDWKYVEYAEWSSSEHTRMYGTRNKKTKRPYGIVREVS